MMVTKDRLCELFRYDPKTGAFVHKTKTPKKNIGDVAGSFDGKGYLRISVDGKAYPAHWLVWLLAYGSLPSGQLDHINRINHDNRIENLREATPAENARNRGMRKDNTSGHTGVYWSACAKKWAAQIKVNGKHINLGHFSRIEYAIGARLLAEKELGFDPSHGRNS